MHGYARTSALASSTNVHAVVICSGSMEGYLSLLLCSGTRVKEQPRRTNFKNNPYATLEFRNTNTIPRDIVPVLRRNKGTQKRGNRYVLMFPRCIYIRISVHVSVSTYAPFSRERRSCQSKIHEEERNIHVYLCICVRCIDLAL